MASAPDWYQRLFAWLMAHGTTSYETAVSERKAALFEGIHGKILEIGPGAGANFTYYPQSVQWTGVEPNSYMHPYLEERAADRGLQIQIQQDNAEQLAADDGTVDAVVSTLVLCSVANLEGVLQEILRVLKPGGSFYFVEHVAAPPHTLLRQTQGWLNPAWQIIGDGCCLTRETGQMIKAAGFTQVSYDDFRAPVPPIVSPQIIGRAIKSS
ncbi:MAG: methyltransferase domain-containing protein [Cyanobacteria bacterium P01_A01_bin.135]